MRWASGVQFSIDTDRKQIDFSDLNVDGSGSSVIYEDYDYNDNNILPHHFFNSTKLAAGYREISILDAVANGEVAQPPRIDGRHLARVAKIFKMDSTEEILVPLTNYHPNGFDEHGNVFLNTGKRLVLDADTDNVVQQPAPSSNNRGNIDGTQLRFITPPAEDTSSTSTTLIGYESTLDASNITFDAYTIQAGAQTSTNQISSISNNSISFHNTNFTTMFSKNSVKFQPSVFEPTVFKTTYIDTVNGNHQHPVYVSPGGGLTSGNTLFNGSYLSGGTGPVSNPGGADDEECFYHTINLTSLIHSQFPEASGQSLSSKIHESGPEYKLSVKIQQLDNNIGLLTVESKYAIQINLGNWFNEDSDGNYFGSSTSGETDTTAPYLLLNSFPVDCPDKKTVSHNTENMHLFYQRYKHTGSDITTESPHIYQNDIVVRIAFKKTISGNSGTNNDFALPNLGYTLIQTA
tara:strand:+ start:1376 stop:2761 length:1386 start_codon:yes stop_codon:yes gene_type:complete